jgi:hypothetical protein
MNANERSKSFGKEENNFLKLLKIFLKFNIQNHITIWGCYFKNTEI